MRSDIHHKFKKALQINTREAKCNLCYDTMQLALVYITTGKNRCPNKTEGKKNKDAHTIFTNLNIVTAEGTKLAVGEIHDTYWC